MGYFDGLTDALFKTAPDGRKIFYPHGIISRGYILPDDATYQKVRRFIKAWAIFWIPFLLIIQFSPAFWTLFFITVPIYLLLYNFSARKMVKGCAISELRLTYLESFTNNAKSQNIFLLLLVLISALFFVALGIKDILSGRKVLEMLPMILTFSIFAVGIGYMIYKKRK
jgi:succinate dehydrogenase hydrophobic anchor subunit